MEGRNAAKDMFPLERSQAWITCSGSVYTNLPLLGCENSWFCSDLPSLILALLSASRVALTPVTAAVAVSLLGLRAVLSAPSPGARLEPQDISAHLLNAAGLLLCEARALCAVDLVIVRVDALHQFFAPATRSVCLHYP